MAVVVLDVATAPLRGGPLWGRVVTGRRAVPVGLYVLHICTMYDFRDLIGARLGVGTYGGVLCMADHSNL